MKKEDYEKKPIKIGKIKVELIWFDSMGAKSSALYVETPDVKLLVDPGSAVMQPSYPLTKQEKEELKMKALKRIKKYAKKAECVFISHYHYDHHTLPTNTTLSLYKGKQLWLKNPNEWINYSQWNRSRLFLKQLWQTLGGGDFSVNIRKNRKKAYQEKMKTPFLKNERLLKWFNETQRMWSEWEWVKEFEIEGVEVLFVDDKEFTLGKTKIKITPPLFHGEEYTRLGWVIGFTLIYENEKILYSSDIQGPVVEEYSDWIIKEKPSLCILDGPTTYLLGYRLSEANLNRAINNISSILTSLPSSLIIYDHHLLRDRLYRDRLSKVYKLAEKLHSPFFSAREWYGKKPLILEIMARNL